MSCNKITLPCLLAHSSHFDQCMIQIDNLLMILLCVNGFAGFQEFLIKNTPLVPPDTNMIFLLKLFGLGVKGLAFLEDTHDFLHFGVLK